jgi:proline-rich protein PRCC
MVGGKKVVTIGIRKELLAAAALDSDEDDEPAAKRIKPGGGKTNLMAFLPPPKNTLAAPVPTLGSGSAKGRSFAAAGEGDGAQERPGPSAPARAAAAAADSAPLPADFFASGYSNEAFRITDQQPSAAECPGYGHEARPSAYGGHTEYGSDPSNAPAASYAAAGPAAAPAPRSYGPAVGPSGRGQGGAVAKAGRVRSPVPEDLLDAALRAEQERASKRGGAAAVKLVEVRARARTS